MKKAVLDLKDYVVWLKENKERIAKEFAGIMTPNQIKKVTTEAVVGSPGERVVAFKEVLDNIRVEGYYNGQMAIIDHLVMVAEQQIKNHEASENVSTCPA